MYNIPLVTFVYMSEWIKNLKLELVINQRPHGAFIVHLVNLPCVQLEKSLTHCIEILKQNTKYTLKKTYSKQKREKRLHLCLKKMLLMANYIV